MGPRPGVEAGMDPRLAELSRRYQRKVTLIGWSLGGAFAREMAPGRDATILRPLCQPPDRGAAPEIRQ